MQEQKNTPIDYDDVNQVGYGWEGLCPCGCGAIGGHAGHDHAHGSHDHANGHNHVHEHSHEGEHHHDHVHEVESNDQFVIVDTDEPYVDAYAHLRNDDDETVQAFSEAFSIGLDEDEDLKDVDSTESDVEFEDLTFHVRRWGAPGEIPMVLLHGFMQDGATWSDVAKRFAQDHCVYALDLVGHGQSSKPDNDDAYTLAHQADQVAACIREVVLPEYTASRKSTAAPAHAHLVGYSMGGRVALAVAHAYPELLNGLVLESAGIGPEDDTVRKAFENRSKAWAAQLLDGDFTAFVDAWEELLLFETQKHLADDTRARVRKDRLDNDPKALAHVVTAAGQHTMQLAAETLDDLSYRWMPVLYVAGTKDASYLANAERFVNYGFDAKAIMAGHNVHLEAPVSFAREVETFLASFEVRGL